MTQYITLPKLAKYITGQRFNRLLALGPIAKNDKNQIVWLCNCDCGNTAQVICSHLKGNLVKSCGCYKIDTIITRNTIHGLSQSPLYRIWADMIKRCTNPKAIGYKNYGERGIAVCDQWRHDFQAFFDYVSKLEHCGENGYSIDRIENNGNYEPGNVRWATDIEQNRNTRVTIMLEFRGQTKNLHAWAEELHFSSGTLDSRLRSGWSAEQILTTPLGRKRRKPRGIHMLTYNGKTQSVAAWEAEMGLGRSMIYKRLRRGWSLEEALTTPPLQADRKRRPSSA